MTIEEAMRKVEACLRLAKSDNAAEAALAAAKAQEIMVRYQIDAAVLEDRRQQQGETGEQVEWQADAPVASVSKWDRHWALRLTQGLARANGCRPIIQRLSNEGINITLVGRRGDVQTVGYMFGLLAHKVRELRTAHTRGWTTREKCSFAFGAASAIAHKVSEQAKATAATVQAEARNGAVVHVSRAIERLQKLGDACEEFINSGTFRTGRRAAPLIKRDAEAAGYAAGSQVDVGGRARGGLGYGGTAVAKAGSK